MFDNYGIIAKSKYFTKHQNNGVKYLSREFNRLVTKKDVVF
jgi:hypothetical protein